MSKSVMGECLEEAIELLHIVPGEARQPIATIAVALYQERCAHEGDHEREYALGRNVTELARGLPLIAPFDEPITGTVTTTWSQGSTPCPVCGREGCDFLIAGGQIITHVQPQESSG